MAKKPTFVYLAALVCIFFCLNGLSFADLQSDLEQADAYRQSGDYEQAEALYQQILDEEAGTYYAVQAQKGLALVYLATERVSQADAVVEELKGDLAEIDGAGHALQEISHAYQGIKSYDKAIEIAQYVVAHWPSEEYAVWAQMCVVMSNIELGNDEEAEAATNSLINGFRDSQDLPCTLHIIAERYEWGNSYDRSIHVYEKTAELAPESPWGQKALLGAVRVNVIRLVNSGSYDLARQQLDLIMMDFEGHPDLPETLSRAAQRFKWARRFDDADELYTLAENLQPESASDETPGIELESQGTQILSLINAGDFSQAQAAAAKLIADFNDAPELPETLHWIAKHYEWLIRYDTAKDMHEKIAQQWPNTPAAERATANIRRLDERIDVFRRMNFHYRTAAWQVINQVIEGLSDNPDLPSELLWVAREYEDSRRFDEARRVYRRITQMFPESDSSKLVQLDIAKIAIVEGLARQDDEATRSDIDNLIAKYAADPHLPDALHWIATKLEDNMQFDAARELYLRIMEIEPDSEQPSKAEIDAAKMALLPLIDEGNLSGAHTAVDKLISDYTDSPHICAALARAARQCCLKGWDFETRGDPEQAAFYFEQAVVICRKALSGPSVYTPEVPDLHYLAAMAYQGMGQYEEAIEQYQAVVNEYPNYRMADRAQVETAKCYKRIWQLDTNSDPAQTGQVIEAYEALLEKYPNCRSARAAKEQLSNLKIISGVNQ